MLLPMAPLHLLIPCDQNEVKPDFLNHGMPLVLALLSYIALLVAPFCLLGKDN